MDCRLEALFDWLVVAADNRLERRNHVANDIFGRIMEQRRQPIARRGARFARQGDLFDKQAVLSDGKGMIADGLSVPAGNTGQAVGDVVDFHIQRRGVEEIEPAAGQHALPGTWRGSAVMRHVSPRFRRMHPASHMWPSPAGLQRPAHRRP